MMHDYVYELNKLLKIKNILNVVLNVTLLVLYLNPKS